MSIALVIYSNGINNICVAKVGDNQEVEHDSHPVRAIIPDNINAGGAALQKEQDSLVRFSAEL